MSVLLFTQLMLEFPEMSEHQEILVPLRTLDQDKGSSAYSVHWGSN